MNLVQMMSQEQAINDIIIERKRQDTMWGAIDRYDNRTGERWLAILMEEVGEVAEAILEKNKDGNLREECVQVAAVALAMIESFDRNNVENRTDGKL